MDITNHQSLICRPCNEQHQHHETKIDAVVEMADSNVDVVRCGVQLSGGRLADVKPDD